jgi:hypothetical protein
LSWEQLVNPRQTVTHTNLPSQGPQSLAKLANIRRIGAAVVHLRNRGAIF